MQNRDINLFTALGVVAILGTALLDPSEEGNCADGPFQIFSDCSKTGRIVMTSVRISSASILDSFSKSNSRRSRSRQTSAHGSPRPDLWRTQLVENGFSFCSSPVMQQRPNAFQFPFWLQLPVKVKTEPRTRQMRPPSRTTRELSKLEQSIRFRT